MTKVISDSPVITPGGGLVGGVTELANVISKGISGSKYDDDIAREEEAARSTQPHLTDPELEPSAAVLKDCSTALSQMGDIGDALIELAAASLKERKEAANHQVALTMNAYHQRMKAADLGDKAADKRLVATCVSAGADALGHAVNMRQQFKLGRNTGGLSEAQIGAKSQAYSSATSIVGDLGQMAGAGFTNAADHIDNDVKRAEADANREDSMADTAGKSASETGQLLQNVISRLDSFTDQAYATDRDQIRPA